MTAPRSAGAVAALALAAALAAAGAARGQEVEVGRSVSTSRTVIDWKSYFSSDMRELVSRSETTTTYDPRDNPPVRVGGVEIDPTRSSPIQTSSTSRYVARPGDPDYGTIRVQSRARTATGEVVDNSFSFKERVPRPPLAVGPMDGQVIDIPPREEKIGDRTLVFRSTSRTVEIVAILAAPTFEDVIGGRNVREIREPGARLAEGSLRVVSASGEPMGFFAGDVRISKGVERAAPR